MTWATETAAGRFDGWWHELRRTLRWRRRLLAAALLAGAMAFALQALAPAPAPGTVVLVAARDLAPGSTLRPLDVRLVSRPAAAVPDGSLTEPGAAVGRTVGSAVRRGEVLTDVRLVGPSMLAGLAAGLVATPVRVADAQAAALLRPGDVIDVLSAGAPDGSEPSARLVASAVRVLSTPPTGNGPLAGDLGQGALLLLATTGPTAERLAAAAAAERLSVVLRRR